MALVASRPQNQSNQSGAKLNHANGHASRHCRNSADDRPAEGKPSAGDHGILRRTKRLGNRLQQAEPGLLKRCQSSNRRQHITRTGGTPRIAAVDIECAAPEDRRSPSAHHRRVPVERRKCFRGRSGLRSAVTSLHNPCAPAPAHCCSSPAPAVSSKAKFGSIQQAYAKLGIGVWSSWCRSVAGRSVFYAIRFPGMQGCPRSLLASEF